MKLSLQISSLAIPTTLILFSNLFLLPSILAQQCNRDAVYRALARASYEQGTLFCSNLLAQTSYSGTLNEDITIPIYTTKTDRRTTEDATVYNSMGTRTVLITTSYSSQKRTAATGITQPYPSYIQQYAPSRVSSACSCIATDVPTYLVYRSCDPSTTTTTYTTLTYTVPASGAKTVTSTYTDTTTKYRQTTGPFPTACPAADGIPYVATDRTSWERTCGAYVASGRPLGPDEGVKAQGFTTCIEKCVDYNVKEGYKQCQAAMYNADTKACFLFNSPGYISFAEPQVQVAALKFDEPSTTVSDYCASLNATP